MRSLLFPLVVYVGFAAASSFKDSSPFLFFSTSEVLATSHQITTAKSLTSLLEEQLSKCLTDIYILAHQPGVSANDYDSSSKAVFPEMQRYFSGEDRRIRSSFSVSQVAGHIDPALLKDLLQSKCNAGSMHLDARLGLFDLADEARPRVISLSMNEIPPGEGRRAAAHVNEMYLKTMMEMLPTNNFTVVYTTTPMGEAGTNPFDEYTQQTVEAFEYEMDHTDGFVHMELKRDLDNRQQKQAAGNGTGVGKDSPLFEKYAYFTPGLFMGLSVTLLLLLILYTGIGALGSLEVSYAAFDKENGPQAQRKQ